MKSWLSILALMVTAVASLFASPTVPDDPADRFGFTAVPQIEASSLTSNTSKISNSCDCKSCECLNCSCTPLEVGQPPDVTLTRLTKTGELLTESRSELTSNRDLLTEPKFTQPQIVPVKTVAVAKKAAYTAPSGHWETRYAGFRGRRSYQVWVPDAAAASEACTNGSCSSGACANGALPGFSFSRGGCRSCR